MDEEELDDETSEMDSEDEGSEWDPTSSTVADDADWAYTDYQRKNRRAEFWGGVLGAGLVIVSILLGIADFVAPAVIIIYIVYMVSQRR